MSQNGTTPNNNDENRAPMTISSPLIVPMLPMYYSIGATNSPGQPYFPPTVYSNVVPYSSNGNYHHGAIGLNYNTYYNSFCTPSHNVLPRTLHATHPVPLMTPGSLLPTPLLTSQQLQYSSTSSSILDNGIERNKNLNIRECQSPVIDQTPKIKSPLQVLDANYSNTNVKNQDSSSASSCISHPDSDPIHLPSSTIVQEVDSDNPQDDFLTFIEQKTKVKTKMPELNPFANEFCFVNNKTPIKETSIETNGVNHNTNDENHQSSSSYRLLFDNLIEKSLESIEAIKKSKKKVSASDISIQCDPIVDSINRSTQTLEKTNNFDLAEQYSLRTIKIIDQLLLNFRNIYQNELHDKCQTMAQTCDELRHLVLFIHHLISSVNNSQTNTPPVDLDNPFITMIQDLSQEMKNSNRNETLSQVPHSATSRDIHPPMAKSSISSFSCRQIDQLPVFKSKLCSLCQKPLDDGEDVFHTLCRSFVSRPNI